MRAILVLCTSLSLIGCATSAPVKAPAAPAPAEAVTLSLGLAPHVATVETIREWKWRGAHGEDVDRSVVHHESVVRQAPAGFAFSTRNTRSDDDPVEAKMVALAEGTQVVVSPVGEVVAVEGVDAHQRLAEAWMETDPRFEEMGEEDRQTFRQVLANLGTPGFLQVQVVGEWLGYASALRGRRLELGRKYKEEEITYGASKRIACTGAGPGDDCVLVEISLPPNDDLLAMEDEVLKRLIEDHPPGPGKGPLVGARSDKIELIVRPADLRPYRMVRTRRAQYMLRVKGRPQFLGRTDVVTTAWTYADEADATR